MDKKHRYISRIDQDSKFTHGWYCRISHNGKSHAKFFSDKKEGSKRQALLSAIAWRTNTLRKFNRLLSNKTIVTVARTNTGVVGVRYNYKDNRYEVHWVSPEGKQARTSVSIGKHGKKKAFRMACEIRERMNSARLAA